jgi:glycosyltransferase involved in cell wall biosynthesis
MVEDARQASSHVRPIKLLYVIGTLEVGGTERQLVEIVSRLDRTRFEPVVCCLSAGGPLEERLRREGITVHVVGFRGFSVVRNLAKVIRQLIRLVRVVRAEAPVIVHGLLFWAYVLGTFAARLVRVPVVIASRRSLGHFKAGKTHYLWIERAANAMTDLIIANSEAVRADVLRQEQVPARKVIVIYNGLDAERYQVGADQALRSSLRLAPGTAVVAVIANFIHYKGYEYFLDAWSAVVRRCPDAVALLVGDGPLRASCEQRASAAGLGPRVRFLGTRPDVPRLLALADVLVHPSTEEGFSNAILEAMAAGRPVVAAAVGGNPEAIVNGETGLLVPARDSRSLADAIVWMIEHPADAKRFGEAGRRRVAEVFDLSAMVRRYEEVYERLAFEKCPEWFGVADVRDAVGG